MRFLLKGISVKNHYTNVKGEKELQVKKEKQKEGYPRKLNHYNMKMKDFDSMEIEKIIRLPFFYSLKKSSDPEGVVGTSSFWEITFICNKKIAEGLYMLLDHESETELVKRYKLIDFK